MAGELNQEINQLKVIVSNKQAELNRLKALLEFATVVNKGDVSQEMKDSLTEVYQELTA